MHIWEVSAWEIAHLGSYHLGNCHLGSRPWENAFVKVPDTGLKKVIYIKEGSEVISNEPPLKKVECPIHIGTFSTFI